MIINDSESAPSMPILMIYEITRSMTIDDYEFTMRPTLGNYFEVEPGSGIFF